MTYQEIITDVLKSKGVPERATPWVIGQSANETARWTSNVFVKLNNGFGMKHPSRRPTTSKGPSTIVRVSEGSTPYAFYGSFADSVADLVLWLQYNKIDWSKIQTADDYAAFLKQKGYMGDTVSNYVNAIKRLWSIAGVTASAAAIGDYVTKNPAKSLVASVAVGAGVFVGLKTLLK